MTGRGGILHEIKNPLPDTPCAHEQVLEAERVGKEAEPEQVECIREYSDQMTRRNCARSGTSMFMICSIAWQ
jgi:hypothetical protein